MKVVYVLNSTLTTSGASKSFLAMLEGLMVKGVRPMIILPDKNGLYEILLKLGIKVVVLNYRPNTYPLFASNSIIDLFLFIPRLLGRICLNWYASRQLVEILTEYKPDIVHTNVSVVNIGYNAAMAIGIPHVYHIREYGFPDFKFCYFPLWRCFRRQLEHFKSYSICITKSIRQYHGQVGNPASNVIYNGIMKQKGTMPYGKGDFFLFAGRLEPAKGIMFLLKAYGDYVKQEHEPLSLKIAGAALSDTYLRRLKNLICRMGIDSYVTFLGERHDMENLMRDAKAIIVSSRLEGFGRVMPEAMFNGCLAIGRDTGGTKEQLDVGLEYTGNEIALRFTTVEELTRHLLMVGNSDDVKFLPYRERAFRTVNALYTIDANVEKVYSLYENILWRRK